MPSSKKKIIMGIDPGLATVGYGFVTLEKNPQFIACGCIETEAKTDFNKRLDIINKELTQLIKKYKPNICGVEQLFFCKNVKTAMSVGHARGVIIMTLGQNKVKPENPTKVENFFEALEECEDINNFYSNAEF